MKSMGINKKRDQKSVQYEQNNGQKHQSVQFIRGENGEELEFSNYTGTLLNVAYKILATCIKELLKREMKEILREYQTGFTKSRSVIV